MHIIPRVSDLLMFLQVIGENRVAMPTHQFQVIVAEGKARPSALGEMMSDCTVEPL